MTSALRLSTAGRGVSEGRGVGVAEGMGVSVGDAVAVGEAVSVGAGGVNDSVGRFGVCVGEAVSAGLGGGVKLQANIVTISKIEKTSFRLIGEVGVPFQKNRC